MITFNQIDLLKLIRERKYHMFTANKHQIYFKHNRSKTTNGHKPKNTLCIIKRGEQVIAQGVAKAAEKILVPVDDTTDLEAFGRRLKEVLKTDEGEKFAVLTADKFEYQRGRKEALTKALDDAGFSREQRRRVWEEYHKNCGRKKKKVTA